MSLELGGGPVEHTSAYVSIRQRDTYIRIPEDKYIMSCIYVMRVRLCIYIMCVCVRVCVCREKERERERERER
jgi:hypothetical protein